jgi:spermidine synthase
LRSRAGLALGLALLGTACRDDAEVRPSLSGAPVVVHRTRGLFGEIAVVDEKHLRHLRVDGVDQTTIDLRDPDALPMPYLQAASLGPLLADAPDSALLIGLGGGGFVRFLERRFPAMRIEAVEIDPAVVRVASEFFGIRAGPRLAIHVEDGAAYLSKRRARAGAEPYDVIFLDGYTGAAIPAHLTRAAFFEDVRAQVAASGVVVANLGLESREEEERILARFAAVFPGRCLQVRPHTGDNRIVLGFARPAPGPEELRRVGRAADRRDPRNYSLEIVAGTRTRCEAASGRAPSGRTRSVSRQPTSHSISMPWPWRTRLAISRT